MKPNGVNASSDPEVFLVISSFLILQKVYELQTLRARKIMGAAVRCVFLG